MFKKFSIVKYILTILILASIGYLLLSISYCIPRGGAMLRNANASAIELSNETEFQKYMRGANASLDGYTDALMLEEATAPETYGPFIDSLLNKYSGLSISPYDAFIQSFQKETNGEDFNQVSYGRYWHGYLIILKPLLLFFSYFTIRYLLMLVEFLLFIWLIIRLVILKKEFLALSTTIVWLFLNPVTTILNMQNATCTIIMFCMSIYVTYNYNKNLSCGFLIVGCLTSFFDLLTFPLITFGIPFIYGLALKRDTEFKCAMLNLLKYGFSWIVGFSLMWICKWGIATIITGQNMFIDAYISIIERSGSALSGPEILTMPALSDNRFVALIQTIIYIIKCSWDIFVYILLLIIFLIIFSIIIKTKRIYYNQLINFITIGITPLLWSFIMINHTYIHGRYTYRILAISVFSFLSFCSYIIEKENLRLSNFKVCSYHKNNNE